MRQAFFADIYVEALNATPARGHRALAGIAAVKKLRREYTLNIDGLHDAVGLTTWHPEKNPEGEVAAQPNHDAQTLHTRESTRSPSLHATQ